jgi:hypothetical protein
MIRFRILVLDKKKEAVVRQHHLDQGLAISTVSVNSLQFDFIDKNSL